MKRTNINPLFKIYDSITYDEIDYTKSGKVNVYVATGDKTLEKGQKLFDFFYEPILKEDDYVKLLDYYDYSAVFLEFYSLISFTNFTIYSQCIRWYIENSKIWEAFNFDEQLKKYELKISDDYCCPIIKYLDLEHLDNINVYRNVKNIMIFSEVNNISSINTLMYGNSENDKEIFNKQPTSHYKLLLNSLIFDTELFEFLTLLFIT